MAIIIFAISCAYVIYATFCLNKTPATIQPAATTLSSATSQPSHWPPPQWLRTQQITRAEREREREAETQREIYRIMERLRIERHPVSTAPSELYAPIYSVPFASADPSPVSPPPSYDSLFKTSPSNSNSTNRF